MMHESKCVHRSNARAVGLIVLGLFWFLWNIGTVVTGDWRSLWSFTPLALVPLGAELLATGHVSWRLSLLTLGIAAAMVVLGAILLFGTPVASG
jgi:hypothetical protein